MVRELSRNKPQTGKIEERKSDHIRICLRNGVQSKKVTTGFEEVILLHRALPQINLEEIDMSTTVFKHKFHAPILVEAITGGTEQALRINASIAEAVEEIGLGMGLGSQRAALENPKLERTFSVAREKAPNAFLIANIGGSQIAKDYGIKEVERVVDMISADALAIHLNPLQEAIQPEGEPHYVGILEKIEKITDRLDVPVIVKETGAGIAAEDAIKLLNRGVLGVDLAGKGGTSWAAVEYHRAKQRGDESAKEIGRMLWDWGIPTAVSLVEVSQSVDLTIIASGGIRSGQDFAKSVALGADLVGFAFPILSAASKGVEKVKAHLHLVIRQLRTVMFLTGCSSIDRLKNVPVVVRGKTADWLRLRGFNLERYARGER